MLFVCPVVNTGHSTTGIFLFMTTMTSNLPRSIRKFIRLEKARIRGQFLDSKKQEEMIGALYNRFLQQPEVKEVNEVKEEKKEVKKTEPKAKKVAKTKKNKKQEIKTFTPHHNKF